MTFLYVNHNQLENFMGEKIPFIIPTLASGRKEYILQKKKKNAGLNF